MSSVPSHGDWRSRLAHWKVEIVPGLLTVAAIVAGAKMSAWPVFKRVSLVVSDTILQNLGAKPAEEVRLVRIRETFTKAQLESILYPAIRTILFDYQAAAVGIDIDFSGAGYTALARNVAKWNAEDPNSARKVVWAAGWQIGSANERSITLSSAETAPCEDCSSSKCQLRFTPLPVFDGPDNPPSYGLSIAFPDADGVNRMSLRFVCHSQTEGPLKAFHFQLVELYCAEHSELATCRSLTPNEQARSTIYSWYESKPLDLCELVQCKNKELGTKRSQRNDLVGKIVLLYSDLPGVDEHLTSANTRKGAEIVGALIENELKYGVVSHGFVKTAEMLVEGILTLLLLVLFHWRRTRALAIVPAIIIFIGYIYIIPLLATWVPDFRNYVLAIILSFWVEAMLKLGWQSWEQSRRSVG